jgi:hypothetical protein
VDELIIWDGDDARKRSTLGGGTGFLVRGKMGYEMEIKTYILEVI